MESAEVVVRLRELPGGTELLSVAAERDGLWLVGGAVRDLMIGREPRELDVLVDGNLAEVAGRLGDSVFHERFGTATVRGAGTSYDLAEPRRESYSEPGSLPDVTPATVEEDLARRDFTINAIAVSLPDGRLVSHPLSIEDLGGGVLRVLHPASFEDDPTRVWRMARYAGRLGFEPDAETAALAAAAGIGQASTERIGAELRLMLDEPDPCAAFEALARYSPQALPDGFVPRPPGVQAALAILPEDGRRDLTVLAACAAGMDVERLRSWLEDLAFPAADRDTVLAASRWVTGQPLREARTRTEVARAARGAPVEAVALAGGENAELWLGELREVRLEIDGDDLIAAGIEPGPRIGEALDRALDAKIEGLCAGRDQEIAAALAEEGDG